MATLLERIRAAVGIITGSAPIPNEPLRPASPSRPKETPFETFSRWRNNHEPGFTPSREEIDSFCLSCKTIGWRDKDPALARKSLLSAEGICVWAIGKVAKATLSKDANAWLCAFETISASVCETILPSGKDDQGMGRGLLRLACSSHESIDACSSAWELRSNEPLGFAANPMDTWVLFESVAILLADISFKAHDNGSMDKAMWNDESVAKARRLVCSLASAGWRLDDPLGPDGFDSFRRSKMSRSISGDACPSNAQTTLVEMMSDEIGKLLSRESQNPNAPLSPATLFLQTCKTQWEACVIGEKSSCEKLPDATTPPSV